MPDSRAPLKFPLGCLSQKYIDAELNFGARLPYLPERGTEGRARAHDASAEPSRSRRYLEYPEMKF